METAPSLSEPRTFVSRAHPADASRALVYARALVTPLATCSLPVMIAALMAALQGFNVMPYLVWGFPGAIGLASLWTAFRLRTVLAEIHVSAERAAVRTVWETLQPAHTLRWLPVLDLRKGSTTFSVAIGYTTYDQDDADWPDLDDLLEALRQARLHARLASRYR